MPSTCCATRWLPDRVTIQQDSKAVNDPDPDYTGPAFAIRVPCRITTASGGESPSGRQLSPTATHVVEMPYRSGLTTTMRLYVDGGIYATRTLNFVAIIPMREPGKRPWLEIDCREEPS